MVITCTQNSGGTVLKHQEKRLHWAPSHQSPGKGLPTRRVRQHKEAISSHRWGPVQEIAPLHIGMLFIDKRTTTISTRKPSAEIPCGQRANSPVTVVSCRWKVTLTLAESPHLPGEYTTACFTFSPILCNHSVAITCKGVFAGRTSVAWRTSITNRRQERKSLLLSLWRIGSCIALFKWDWT